MLGVGVGGRVGAADAGRAVRSMPKGVAKVRLSLDAEKASLVPPLPEEVLVARLAPIDAVVGGGGVEGIGGVVAAALLVAAAEADRAEAHVAGGEWSDGGRIGAVPE